MLIIPPNMILRSRLFYKILLSYVALLLGVLAVVDFFFTHRLQQRYVDQEQIRLETAARILSHTLPQDLEREAQSWAVHFGGQTGFRITLIDTHGTVLADNESEPRLMNDHSNRPEFKQAMQLGMGQSVRFSRTLGKNLLYVAYRISRPGAADLIIRLALPLQEVAGEFRPIQRELLLISVSAFLLALALGYVLTRSVTGRIDKIREFSSDVARGDFSARIRESSSDELGNLAQSLNETADELQRTVNELRGERDRIHAILESMQAGVLATDAEGRVTTINSALARVLGISPEGSLQRKLLEVIRDVELKKILDQALEQNTQITATVEMTLESPRTFEVVAIPIREGSARPRGVVAVLHDITKLLRLEKVRKDFVANVSHELRTPLTSIRGFAETLLEGALEDKKNNRRFVEIIRNHAVQLSNLTSDLLTLTALESSDSMPLKLESLELKPILEEAVEILKPLARGKQQELTVEIGEGLPPLRGDREKLRQVFLNLLDNAIKFTGEGGQISVQATVPAESAVLEIHVKDNGIGIPSTDLPRIFERFYRVDKARSREQGGTGLGLAIVKHIVEAHNGRVDVSSTLGQGSDFSVILPVERA
jgi:two-component system phosphate regulon sensor histidine kinase PhoR